MTWLFHIRNYLFRWRSYIYAYNISAMCAGEKIIAIITKLVLI